MRVAQREYFAIGTIGLVFLLFLAPAFFASRTEVRDELRRRDIANLKRGFEKYNNAKNHYGLIAKDGPNCTTTNDPASGLLGDKSELLKGGFIDAIPHDVRDRDYFYCATDINEEDKVMGFYLEAQLERPHEDQVGFDEDEMRKFNYRILNEDSKIKYRVCGGTEKQCE